ncbi:hypothetical protein BYT27DRAFT_7223358 [Phlegmacium glaucopus]|nr:hypothetical protein BYT27DRAFT_7223358 [Phlegmacium glaucopus]
MPIALPNPPAGHTELPPPPQDPATLTDICNAVAYNKRLLVSREVGIATKDDVGRGVLYQTAITTQHAGAQAGQPQWFGPALAAGLAAGLAPLTRITSMTYNLLSGDGRSRPFQVIPFANGVLPTDPPHNLPALVDIVAIRMLTGPEATAYLVGYNLPVPNAVRARKVAICHEIGCTTGV